MTGLTGISLFCFVAATVAVCADAELQYEMVCEHRTMSLGCPSGEQVYTMSASYGRRSNRLCTTGPIHTTNCHSGSSLSRVSSACDRQSSCSVAASNSVFGDPCVGTFKYLEVVYVCASWTQRRVCERSTLNLSCPTGQTIIIGDALYGRTTGASVCPASSRYVQEQNCRASSSLSTVRSRCEGRNSCSVPATNDVFGDPCVGTYKYLEVQFDCV
ncbi:L-rhamnose-binding lectin CSL3-like [Diadema antillarum]|uniref:L-rhamnose-binding lectin CSL3-like n=1 Tax=Diadema antillarum TaxID=105358 RepID=UPI003A8923F3